MLRPHTCVRVSASREMEIWEDENCPVCVLTTGLTQEACTAEMSLQVPIKEVPMTTCSHHGWHRFWELEIMQKSYVLHSEEALETDFFPFKWENDLICLFVYLFRGRLFWHRLDCSWTWVFLPLLLCTGITYLCHHSCQENVPTESYNQIICENVASSPILLINKARVKAMALVAGFIPSSSFLRV